MVFSSLVFLFAYLPLTMVIYYITPRKWRNVFLFFINLVFYGWGEPLLVLLMVFNIIFNYIGGWLVDKYRQDQKEKKLFLVLTCILDIGILFVFKYTGFMRDILATFPPVKDAVYNGISFLHLPNLFEMNISLPVGTRMALIADGLLGGMAIELQLPNSQEPTADSQEPIAKGSFLPTTYVPGLIESVQTDLLAHVDEAVQEVDSLVAQVRAQIEGNHLQATLQNVDRISSDLTYVSADIKQLMQTKVPAIVNNADTAVANLNAVAADLKQADLKATVARVDTAVDGINSVIADVRDQKGTLGQLLYNKSLYDHIDATVVTADSLLTDLKAHPKRYVHFSLFGKKDK